MYRIKFNQPQALAAAKRARANANHTLLIASTAVVVIGASTMQKKAHCQHDPTIHAEARELKERVQEFTEHVLELADNPPRSTSSSSSSSASERHFGNDRGHGSSFFSSGGHRRVEPRHGGFNFSRSYDEDGLGSRGTRMEYFRGAYVDKDEELVPAVLYMAGAGIIGSFLARRSNFLVRFLSPIALALGASAYTIPKTTNNVIYGLKNYNYHEWHREWQHKMYHARKSIADTTHEIQSGLGAVATGAKDAVHDLTDKSHEITDKAQHSLHDAKEKTIKIAHDVQDKGSEVVKSVSNQFEHAKEEVEEQAKHAKQWWKSHERDAEKYAKDLKHSAQESGEHVKHWWNSHERDAEKYANDLKRSAKEAGEQTKHWWQSREHDVEKNVKNLARNAQESGEDARDWFHDQGRRVRRDANQSYNDLENGFDRFRSQAREEWNHARNEVDHGNKRAQDKFQDARDQGRDWARKQSHHFHNRYHDFDDQGQEWTREWANERRHDIENIGRDLGDKYEHAKQSAKKFGRELQEDYGEDRFRDTRRDIRNRAEDVRDHGRRQLNRFEDNVDAWGYGRREGDDIRRNNRRYFDSGAYDGRGGRGEWGYENYSNEPRRSVTEVAKEGRHWWQHKSAADPYESYDRQQPSGASWWQSGSSSATQAKDKVADEFDHAKRQARRSFDDLRDRVEDKSQQLKGRFEHSAREVQNKLGELSHGYRDEQGRDFGGSPRRMFGAHGSIYSDDYWFHSGPSNSGRREGGRGL